MIETVFVAYLLFLHIHIWLYSEGYLSIWCQQKDFISIKQYKKKGKTRKEKNLVSLC